MKFKKSVRIFAGLCGNAVPKCKTEWKEKKKWRPTTHVCALEEAHLNRHICRCGLGRLK